MTQRTRPITRVLIANRGEIAVRILRACRDEGIRSVVCYADTDHDAPFVRMADEAYPLGGETAANTYLDVEKLVGAAKLADVDAVHPGYGFLSENADFAQAVIDAGLLWVGPPPAVIKTLGNKVTARGIAEQVGAPLAPGTGAPVADAGEVRAFIEQHGLPVAIKAAFGGGGRGLRIVRRAEEVEDTFAAAVRESTVAFGRGECFVERYLDKARHVEVQVLGDQHGNICVLGTRDCSLQRRHQKLVEEAPAPFLTEEQLDVLTASAKAICTAVGYESAGTVEYLIGADGLISFLEVNTRLQVEHPVTEETTGLDLVRLQFLVARGEPLEIPDMVMARGHAIEFRINGEDPGRGFLPSPGTVARFVPPLGPGVRLDTGVAQGTVVGGQFDSLMAKLVVSGSSRQEALARARRALDEIVLDGLPTVLPFHRAVVEHPDFTAEDGQFLVHTAWIESAFHNAIPPFETAESDASDPGDVVIHIGREQLHLHVPGLAAMEGDIGRDLRSAVRERTVRVDAQTATGAVSAPMQGTVVKVLAEEGAEVSEGDVLVVVEAMKMENPVKAHRAGVVRGMTCVPGQTVAQSDPICEIHAAGVVG
jgi:acetyl-CoA/propionyl-CoA carboxylase biotin carboxyl carrier protein